MSEPAQSTVKLPLPEQIIAGRYRIICRLGSGGMGLVFLAEQLGVGNKVALKFLDPEPGGDETRIARFLREAKVGLQVQHPGATQILDLGRDESMRLFLCFELVDGEDLRDLIRKEGRLRVGEARAIALQVAQVLAFAHERQIVHRDVKPENIRVRRDLAGPHVKVLDFGIARLLSDTGVRLTGEGMLAGTPRYMAPEQVKDEPFDGRVDQYALGLVLYEMLTGAVAIGGKNITQILMQQLQTLVPPLAWVDPALAHPGLDALIGRACAKDPAARFPSMAQFIEALQALQVDERAWPPPAPPPSSSAAASAPTRDAREAPPPVAEPPKAGLSDTLVRVPVQTAQEKRLEVITEPERAKVARRAPSEAPTDPEREAVPRPIQLTPDTALELPTDPERPAVRRPQPPLPSARSRPAPQQTVMGMQVPARPRRSALTWWLLGGGLLLLLSGIAWLVARS